MLLEAGRKYGGCYRTNVYNLKDINPPIHSSCVRLVIPLFDAVTRRLPHGSLHHCLRVTFTKSPLMSSAV